jgi:single-strand DNA-binding protein
VTDTVTLAGVVATKPENVRTSTGLTVTNFRLASSQRRFDRATSTWVEGDTNWYTVNAYRWMANNVANSLEIGNHVVLTGRLRVRNWSSGDKRGTAIEVDVDSIGHDLAFGVSHFTRLKAAVPAGQAGAPSDETGEPDPLASEAPGSANEIWATLSPGGEPSSAAHPFVSDTSNGPVVTENMNAGVADATKANADRAGAPKAGAAKAAADKTSTDKTSAEKVPF